MPHGSTGTIEDRKRRTLEIWVDNPTLKLEDIAKMARISDKTFYRYRQDKEFMEEYHRMCQDRFKNLEAKAISKLEEQLDNGNFSAVKYVLDGQGYLPNQKIDINTPTVIQVSIDE